ncbi:MAG: type IV pilin-like G/H family protein [Cyanobacteria bacterium P01_A01_bin.135]
MKTDFKVKLLQHLAEKRKDEGFTLIELLVVIIIIGILAAIALPTFLNQANRARESEAKTYIGTMNRGQQAYYLEEQEFGSAISLLGLGLATDTDNYDYQITLQGTGETAVTNQAKPSKGATAPVRAYIGGVSAGVPKGTGEATTFATLCEGVKAPLAGGPVGTDATGFTATDAPTCPDPDVTYKKLS